MPKFSITTPVTYDITSPDDKRMPRYDMFRRCVLSLSTQTNKDFEWIIADDKCNPPVEELLQELKMDWWIPEYKVIELPEKSGRFIGRNAAMKEAKGDWICWLDADDEYASTYLEMINNAIEIYPDTKIFNFNHLIFGYDYTAYVRKFINMDIQKELPFRAGVVGAGSFVFHKSIYEEIGPIPELGLWDFAKHAFEEFPEIKPFYWNEQKQDYDTLGNPYGEDFYYFYKMTRKYKSQYIDAAPYYVHSRWGHSLPGSKDFIKDPGAKPEMNPNNI